MALHAPAISATPLTYSLCRDHGDFVVFCFSKPRDADCADLDAPTGYLAALDDSHRPGFACPLASPFPADLIRRSPIYRRRPWA